MTILEAATASVSVPAGIVLKRGAPRVFALAPRSDRRTAAWLEIRCADTPRGIDATVGGDRAVLLRASEGARDGAVPLAVVYHQY